MLEFLKWTFSTLATFFIWLLGGWDLALISLITVLVLDYLSGLAKAYVKGTLSSSVGFKGIIKKFAMLGLVALATVLDHLSGNTGMIRSLVIYYFVANEGLSIIENLAEMDIGVPKVIKDKLEQLKEKGD